MNRKKYEEEIQKQIEESQSFSYNLFKQAEKIEGSTQNSECDKYKQRLIFLYHQLVEYDKTEKVRDTFYFRLFREEFSYLEDALLIKRSKYNLQRISLQVPNLIYQTQAWERIYDSCIDFLTQNFLNERIQLYVFLDLLEEVCYNSLSQMKHWRENYMINIFSNKKKAEAIAKVNKGYVSLLSEQEQTNMYRLYNITTDWVEFVCQNEKMTEEQVVSLIDYAINIIGEDLQAKYLIYMFSDFPEEIIKRNINDLLPYQTTNCDTGESAIIDISKVYAIAIPDKSRLRYFLNYFLNKGKITQELLKEKRYIYFPYINLLFADFDGNHRLARLISDKNVHVNACVYDFTKLFDKLEVTFGYDPNSYTLKYKSYWAIKEADGKTTKKEVLDIRFAILFALAKQKQKVHTYFMEDEKRKEQERKRKEEIRLSIENNPYSNEFEDEIIGYIKTSVQNKSIINISEIANSLSLLSRIKDESVRQEYVRRALISDKGNKIVKRKILSQRYLLLEEVPSDSIFDSLEEIPISYISKELFKVVYIREDNA